MEEPQFRSFVCNGQVWPGSTGPRVCTGSTLPPDTPSKTRRRDTPPIVDIPVIMLFVFQQSKSYVYCAAIQFLDRVLDIPVVPQKGDSTVQSLNKVVDAGCARQLPVVQTVLQLRSPTRSSTSLFSRSEQEVPQIQSSTELNDDLEQFGCFFGACCAIFRILLRGVESRCARIFRALDDEEFFVVEGSLEWRGHGESDSQVTCHM